MLYSPSTSVSPSGLPIEIFLKATLQVLNQTKKNHKYFNYDFKNYEKKIYKKMQQVRNLFSPIFQFLIKIKSSN